MASLQSNSTFSFKHHLAGEAWPVSRAILPFHSNTTLQASHGQFSEQFYLFILTPLDRRCMLGMVSVYRTYVHYIAKNRRLNIVLQAELYLRTNTYDRPKNTLAIDSARARSTLPWSSMRPAPLLCMHVHACN